MSEHSRFLPGALASSHVTRTGSGTGAAARRAPARESEMTQGSCALSVSRVNTRIRTHGCTYNTHHKHAHTQTHTHSQHTHTHTHTHTQIHMHVICIQIHKTHTHTHTGTQGHRYTHARATHTHTHTHAHTHEHKSDAAHDALSQSGFTQGGPQGRNA